MQRSDIKKVLIIGSGPIVIGQACEFDYSGTQACKALRSLGYQIVLVNSNPATIMTDPSMADATYIEPLNLERLEQIIAKERPDALLPNLGGQTGLNMSSALAKAGILDKYNVMVIGVNLKAIERGEDREIFKRTMQELGIDTPRSGIANTMEEAETIAKDLGFPLVVRPAYTMGGAGGGFVYNAEELQTIARRGLDLSMTHQILVEESIKGWEELEIEVVRDAKNQMVCVCTIENIDPVGVHTGDSFCAAPMLTIAPELMKRLEQIAFTIVETIGIIGGTNVQFAHDPVSGRVVIIEINPRTSRSSALASKATGFPIALVSAKLAAGMTLDELPYWREGTLEKYTPSGDYIVLKFARWAFEKFRAVEDKLGTQMKAVGEVMSIGKTYKEALQKAIRGLEKGRYGLGFANNFNSLPLKELVDRLRTPSSETHFIMYEALRKGATDAQIFEACAVKAYFVQQMRELVELEEKILEYKGALPPKELLIQAKKDGFSDRYLAKLLAIREKAIREARDQIGIQEGWHAVAVSGVENKEYYYSTYNAPDALAFDHNPKKVMILGGGPNRIGQGIEFDYCCCHAAFTLREMGYETVMVNCNPETVSTDYDTSDRLYFEPVTVEDVLQIYRKEKPLGIIVQFGGQTPLNIARELSDAGCKILGTSIDSIDIAEDRDLFRHMMAKLEIPMPESGMAINIDEALVVAQEIGFPLMIRPSFVLGGRGMEVIYDVAMLREYVDKAVGVSEDRPLLLDRFLQHALECEADAVSDGENVFIPAVMEHVELAGVHSGDSACILPSANIPADCLATIHDYTQKIAKALKVCGLMNMQYAIEKGKVYVIEANPRASRTVPLVSKVCAIQMAPAATRIMLGEPMAKVGLQHREIPYYGAKEAVFPFDKFPEVDPVLGPEMRSTGEV
ncbi:MAG: carbamoyl-phosphate synthase large subunit, partial [Kiritimatiellia bacterium]